LYIPKTISKPLNVGDKVRTPLNVYEVTEVELYYDACGIDCGFVTVVDEKYVKRVVYLFHSLHDTPIGVHWSLFTGQNYVIEKVE
jgi:hypothetical protein